MDTKNIKDEQIRKQIITASEVYRDKLAGRVFLYVYGESYFEVVFPTDRFRHLTGVNSSISAQEFYDKAKSSMLSVGQIFYDREHTYRGAKRKLPCLTMLPTLTNNVVCVVKDMKTVTLTYKIGVTNLDFTIGLSENLDLEGNKINDWFLPRTLRVKDKAIESSADAEFIDFIFSKDASVDKYSTMTYADKDKKPPFICQTETVFHALAKFVGAIISIIQLFKRIAVSTSQSLHGCVEALIFQPRFYYLHFFVCCSVKVSDTVHFLADILGDFYCCHLNLSFRHQKSFCTQAECIP